MVTTYVGERHLPPPPTRRSPPYALWALVLVVSLLVSLCLFYDGQARYAALDAPVRATPCVVSTHTDCTIQTEGGEAVAYWVAWNHAPGLATATAKAGR